jgi:uncharacterized protein YggE
MFGGVLKVGAQALVGTIGVIVALVTGAVVVNATVPDLSLFPKRTIAIQGLADLTIEADKVGVSASVKTTAATASEALEKNSAIMTALIAGLTGDGIERRDISTTSFGIRPLRGRGSTGASWDDLPVTGYVAETSFSVSRPIAQYSGKIVDRLVRLGASEIGQIDFIVSDVGAHEGTIRLKAVQDAQRKGESVAKALGLRLGRVVRVDRDEKSDNILSGRDFVGSPSNQSVEITTIPRTRTFSGAVNVVFELD